MALLLKTLFWLCLLAILHTYLFYPLLLRWLARGKRPNTLVYGPEDNWPRVSVIMSAYNEEAVIEQKLNSLLGLQYPQGRLAIYIGSDCSSDSTNEIVAGYAAEHPHLHFFPFTERRGKPGVINELSRIAIREAGEEEHIFVLTDASVMMSPGLLSHLIKHFKNPAIGLVDTHMVHTGMQEAGISRAEDQYISSEVSVKHLEGRVWGKMIGPFGGCYALRAKYYTEVPPTFLVDDFYITMKVFEQGADAINELEAICYEAVSHDIREEYRRKSRISAGNFQNLFTFPHLWWPPTRPLAFAFFSHKVLRWIGPFLLIFMLLSSGLLSLSGNLFYTLLFCLIAAGMVLLPLLDSLLQRLQIDLLPLRGARYFVAMNVALLEGFIKFIKGIRSNVWEPTKRN